MTQGFINQKPTSHGNEAHNTNLVALTGDLGGTWSAPGVFGMQEAGSNVNCTMSAVLDGSAIKRSGTTWAGLPSTGLIYQLNAAFTSVSASLSAAGTALIKTYSLAANNYGSISARAYGWVRTSGVTSMHGTFYFSGGGVSMPVELSFCIGSAAVGTGTMAIIPWHIENGGVQTAATNINLNARWVSGTMIYNCIGFVVEGML